MILFQVLSLATDITQKLTPDTHTHRPRQWRLSVLPLYFLSSDTLQSLHRPSLLVWWGSGALLQLHHVLDLMPVKCIHIYIPAGFPLQGPHTTHLCAQAQPRVSHQQQVVGLVPLVIYIDSVSFLFKGMKTR